MRIFRSFPCNNILLRRVHTVGMMYKVVRREMGGGREAGGILVAVRILYNPNVFNIFRSRQLTFVPFKCHVDTPYTQVAADTAALVAGR